MVKLVKIRVISFWKLVGVIFCIVFIIWNFFGYS